MNSNINDTTYKARVLVVDDEASILLGLKHELTTNGYEVKTAEGGLTALAEIGRSWADLVILDLMMPDCDGLEVIRRTREGQTETRDLPIIVLSARGEERQKVAALDLGANDYLTKPFGLEELLARVRVALRSRQPGYAVSVNVAGSSGSLNGEPSLPPVKPGLLLNTSNPSAQMLGNWQLAIDLTRHVVQRSGEEIKLTPKQFDLLKYLMHNPDKLLTHRMLLQNVWGGDHQRQTEYLHVFIGQLRQKIEPNPAKPRFILTEPGLGYRFKLPSH